MTTAGHRPEHLSRDVRGTAAKWGLRALIVLAVIAMLVPVVAFLYPWLVAYGVLG